MDDDLTRDIANVLGGNETLARFIRASLERGIQCPWVTLRASSIAAMFQAACDAASRDLEGHPQGKRFLRLVCDGPLHPDAPYDDAMREAGPLSDAEAAVVLEFIHAVMVNRFKAELAEFIALPSAMALLEQYHPTQIANGSMMLYWGDTIRQSRTDSPHGEHFLKGADGIALARDPSGSSPAVLAIFEVKAMPVSHRGLYDQLQQHAVRLAGGFSVETADAVPVRMAYPQIASPMLIALTPNGRRMSRDFTWSATPRTELIPSHRDPVAYEVASRARQDGPIHRVQLDISREELDAAAFAMTHWYMGVAGEFGLDGSAARPRDVTMSAGDDGRNRVKHMLYALALRPLADRHRALTAKLFNILCYGYALGAGSADLLWPEDFRVGEVGATGTAPRIRYQRGPRTFESTFDRGWRAWRTESQANGRAWTCRRTVRGLEPHGRYAVGFHCGLQTIGEISACATTCLPSDDSRDVWHELALQVAETNAPPSPFPADPVIMRAALGTQAVVADGAGAIRVAFRLSDSITRHDVCRFVVALNPEPTTRAWPEA